MNDLQWILAIIGVVIAYKLLRALFSTPKGERIDTAARTAGRVAGSIERKATAARDAFKDGRGR